MNWYYYRIWDGNTFIGVWRSRYDSDIIVQACHLAEELEGVFPEVMSLEVEMLSGVITIDQLIEDSK